MQEQRMSCTCCLKDKTNCRTSSRWHLLILMCHSLTDSIFRVLGICSRDSPLPQDQIFDIYVLRNSRRRTLAQQPLTQQVQQLLLTLFQGPPPPPYCLLTSGIAALIQWQLLSPYWQPQQVFQQQQQEGRECPSPMAVKSKGLTSGTSNRMLCLPRDPPDPGHQSLSISSCHCCCSPHHCSYGWPSAP